MHAPHGGQAAEMWRLRTERNSRMAARKPYIVDTMHAVVTEPTTAARERQRQQARATALAANPLRSQIQATATQAAATRARLEAMGLLTDRPPVLPQGTWPPLTTVTDEALFGALPRHITYGPGGTVHAAVHLLRGLPDARLNTLLNRSPYDEDARRAIAGGIVDARRSQQKGR